MKCSPSGAPSLSLPCVGLDDDASCWDVPHLVLQNFIQMHPAAHLGPAPGRWGHHGALVGPFFSLLPEIPKYTARKGCCCCHLCPWLLQPPPCSHSQGTLLQKLGQQQHPCAWSSGAQGLPEWLFLSRMLMEPGLGSFSCFSLLKSNQAQYLTSPAVKLTVQRPFVATVLLAPEELSC